ncbi:MAG TPA: PPC domain-containing protein [Tepidisphaeraceae bacterium]|nr:PPC domain-containing protein [Tepidisphaeraceae bacterium]
MLLLAIPHIASAEDKKPDPAKALPHVIMTLPLALSRGTTTTIILRGQGLANATEVSAETENASLRVKIKSKGKADLPKPELLEKMGDTQVEVELKIPEDAPGDQIKLTIVTPNGTSETRAIPIYKPGDLVADKEPNGGFHNAQEVQLPATLIGTIGKENAVHVFRISAKAGQKISAGVTAAKLGSALDSLLTIYDEHGEVVAANDDADADSPDSHLNVTLPHDGVYYISLTDAQGNGGAMYPWLLHITAD